MHDMSVLAALPPIREAALGAEVSYDRLMRAVTRGEVPARMIGIRYRIACNDVPKIAAHFAQINATRAVAVQVEAGRAQRKEERASRRS